MQQKNRRREPRIRSKGQVVLITGEDRSIPGTVHDISGVGICVTTSEKLAPGLQLTVETHVFSAPGVVRHCVNKDGTHYVGIDLDPNRPEPDDSGSGPQE